MPIESRRLFALSVFGEAATGDAELLWINVWKSGQANRAELATGDEGRANWRPGSDLYLIKFQRLRTPRWPGCSAERDRRVAPNVLIDLHKCCALRAGLSG